MIEIKAKLKAARAAYMVEVKGRLPLPFAARQQRGLKAKLDSGEEVVLNLPRGEVLRGGDLVTASDGRVVEVQAAAEKLLHASLPGAAELAQAAYRLGDRHVPVEFRPDGLRVAADAAVERMLRELGAKLSEVEAPFEPEVAEHAVGHRHDHGHDHDHVHDDDHGHDHRHRHDHGRRR